jgi:hypothetical protein
MGRWFLSYNAQDLSLHQQIEARLRSLPGTDLFYAPASLRAGGYWLPTLADEINTADAFLLLIGEKGLGPWQVLEYYEALDRRVKQPGFPVIVLLLQGQPAPGLPFLRQLHWIVKPDLTAETVIGKIQDAVAGRGSQPGELWRYTAPYRGLAAMTEADSNFFFGRTGETVAVLKALASAPDRLPLLIGNSGVGKSSLAQAGVIGALKRQVFPEGAKDPGSWPVRFCKSRRWVYLTLKPGTDPLRALVEPFLRTWQLDPTDPKREEHRDGWVQRLLDGKATLSGLLDATEERLKQLGHPTTPAFLLYVDQGEELYVRSEERQGRHFSEVVAHGALLAQLAR